MKKYSFFALLCLNLSSVSDAGGVNVGTGGDWRRTLLNHAKRAAANWVNSVATNLDVADSLAKDSVAYKFLVHPNALAILAADVITSEHVYLTEASPDYTTCAWTNDTRRDNPRDIVFSLTLCEGGLSLGGQKYANRLLIHESVHHLLLDQNLRNAIGADPAHEEELCDEIAEIVETLYAKIQMRQRDRWQDISGPFNLGDEIQSLAERGFHAGVWAESLNKMIVWGGCNQGSHGLSGCGEDGYLGDGGLYDPEQDRWAVMKSEGAPSPRAEMSFLWTGISGEQEFRNMFAVWGGCVDGDGCEKKLGDGAFYKPLTDQWLPIAASLDSPSARTKNSMVWSGRELIIWGGYPQNVDQYFGKPLDDGGIYNPLTNTWRRMSRPNDIHFAARGHHDAFWIDGLGDHPLNGKMLVLGGCTFEVADRCPQSLNDAAFYDPAQDVWARLVAKGQTPKARHSSSVLYVQALKRIYVFGGFDQRGQILSDGGVLDLATMTWMPMPQQAEGRAMHTAVWANGRMVIFGGFKADFAGLMTYGESVLTWQPSAQGGVWQTVRTEELIPLKTIRHSAFWTGESMLVWGGQTAEQQFTNLGSRLFLNADSE